MTMAEEPCVPGFAGLQAGTNEEPNKILKPQLRNAVNGMMQKGQ